MQVAIVHKVKGQKECKTVEFTGDNAMAQGMQYIYYQQPIEVVVVRIGLHRELLNV